ncbi:MAG: right-handed parallel beta-helix repeat-containing protein [Kiritimatiellae bacterium]|jgi:predicted outer membrane repeat protein|nr:right-handed parallel beta-helix repeat-containing protein [Kiritimatiellia bacterium]
MNGIIKKTLTWSIVLASALISNAAIITVTSGDDSGAGTLRQAVLDAGANDTIDFDGVSLVTLSSEIADNNQDGLTIDGGEVVSITTEGESRAFKIQNSYIDWTLDGLTFTNCAETASDGGAIYLYSKPTLTVQNCTFVDCFSTNNDSRQGGGAIMALSKVSLTCSNTTFSSCTTAAAGGGGAIACSGGDVYLTVQDCTFENCSSENEDGGAILLEHYWAINVNIEDSLFDTCSAASEGGAVYARESTFPAFDISGCTFTNCTAGDRAGAIYYGSHSSSTNNARIDDCKFIDNTCGYAALMMTGGAGTMTLSDSTFIGNESTNSFSTGGAIYQQGFPDFTVENCTFKENESYDGGAIEIRTGSNLITGCLFDGNISRHEGGAISAQSAGVTDVANSTFVNNSAVLAGGAIYVSGISVDGESFKIYNSTITTNYCGDTRRGGIMFNYDALNTAVFSSIVYGNYSEGTSAGQDISASDAIENIENCLIGDADGWLATVEANNITETDPLLGELADNGGPTLTVAISKNSPARDAGSNLLNLLYDQRGVGFTREYGAGVDIGAFEYEPAPPQGTLLIIE